MSEIINRKVNTDVGVGSLARLYQKDQMAQTRPKPPFCIGDHCFTRSGCMASGVCDKARK